MGASNSKPETETINWNCIKTENVSSQIPNFNLSNDARKLIASLNIPEITESPVSEFNIDFILEKINTGLNRQDRENFNKMLEHVSSKSANTLSDNNCGSDTSPFISSEMYEYIFNNKSRNQTGGAKKNKKAKKQSKNKNKKGGSLEIDEDDSSTSSTSSDSDLEDILDSTEEDVVAAKKKKEHMKHENKEYQKHENKKHDNKKYDNKKHDNKKHHTESSDNMSGGDELSYLSSSAHTDGEFSDSKTKSSSSDSSSSEKKNDVSSSEEKTVSDANTNAKSESVNTSDINMISDK